MKNITFILLIAFLLTDCEKWNLEQIDLIEISTAAVDSISLSQVIVKSNIKGIKNEILIEHGHVWSTILTEPTISLNQGIDNLGMEDTNGEFCSPIDTLRAGTTYYVRGFAQTESQTIYGNTIEISTKNISVTTDSIQYITAREAILHGHLSRVDLDLTINDHGFCWSTDNSEPTIEDDHVTLGTLETNGSFAGTMTGLIDNQQYYYRAYAKTNFGTTINYGKVKTFEARLINIWEPREEFPVEGCCFSAFSYNGKGYVYAQNRLQVYDPTTDSWALEGPINPNNEIFEPITFVIDHTAYFMIGGPAPDQPGNACYKYDFTLQEWDVLDSFNGSIRTRVVGYAPGNGKGYAGCGIGTNDIPYHDFYEYDPSDDNWTQVATYMNDSWGHDLFSMVIEGKGYIGGGFQVGLKNFYHYDLDDHEFSKRDTFPGGDSYWSAAFTIGQIGYNGTGASDESPRTKNFWAYNSATDSWSAVSDFGGEARSQAFAFAIGNKGYVGGGLGGLTDFWEYKATLD